MAPRNCRFLSLVVVARVQTDFDLILTRSGPKMRISGPYRVRIRSKSGPNQVWVGLQRAKRWTAQKEGMSTKCPKNAEKMSKNCPKIVRRG